MDGPYFIALNAIIDFLFVSDLIINFRTTFINQKTGEEIYNTKKIRMHYIKGRFWIDFLATVPFDVIAEAIFTNSSTTAL